MKNSNVCESPISHDTLLITDAEYGVKRKVAKPFLEISMRQFHNDLIASSDDVGLLGSIHINKHDVIISDTMLGYLEPPQLSTMTDHHKMMCGSAICNTSKYFQDSLNAWWRKLLKFIKDKSDHSLRREEYELTQALLI